MLLSGYACSLLPLTWESSGSDLTPASLQVYGYQGIKGGESSEHLVGRFASQAGADKPLVLGTKFFTVPWTNLLVRTMSASARAPRWTCCRNSTDVHVAA